MMHFKPPVLSKEFVFKTSRSGGKGGQNVNKVSTKVQVEFAIGESQLLSEEEKEQIRTKLAKKLTADGVLQVMAQTERTQLANKAVAVKKIYELLNKCFVVPKKRKPTKVSKAAIQKRLNNKKKRAELKQSRKTTGE